VPETSVRRGLPRTLPGGALSVAVIVAEDDLASDQPADRGSLVGCIVGAFDHADYLAVSGLE
jgi:hypothetical protein